MAIMKTWLMSHSGMSDDVMMCSFSTAADTNHHKLNDLKQQSLFSHSSRGWQAEIKVSAGH